MFYVPQKPNIKRSPNGIKTDGELFWNIYDFLEEKSTRDGARGGHEAGGRAPNPHGHPVRRLMLFFCRKKANFMRKIWAKDSPQSELRISGYIRNGERAEPQNAETERDRETDPISEGLSPLPCHVGQGPEGKPFSHLGRRSRKKKKGPLSPSLPVAPKRCRGHHHHHRDLHQHLRHLHQHLHHLPPSIYSSPLSRNPLYPLLEHGALCFILLSSDVLPSYDV